MYNAVLSGLMRLPGLAAAVRSSFFRSNVFSNPLQHCYPFSTDPKRYVLDDDPDDDDP